VLQFEAVLLWLWAQRPDGLCFDPARVQLWQWLTFLLFVAVGQALNVGIYRAIGTEGEEAAGCASCIGVEGSIDATNHGTAGPHSCANVGPATRLGL
jgi:hypothetical protein